MPVLRIMHSSVPGRAPTLLEHGQIAINDSDGILYYVDADSSTIRSFSLKNPTVPNQTLGTSDTTAANTAFVASAIADLIDGAPVTLNTLNELAAAINDDPAFFTTMNNALINRLRVDAAQGLPGASQD